MRTQRSTIWRACWWPGKTRCIIARRLVRMAIEDIGLADPEAMHQCLAAKDAYDFLGSPEGELALAQATIYLATAPKSNAAYVAFGRASERARKAGSLMPPKIILNAPTRLMKSQEYGAGYRYDHDEPDAFSGQNYFPEGMERERFYDPPERGFEREIRKRLESLGQEARHGARLRRASRGGGTIDRRPVLMGTHPPPSYPEISSSPKRWKLSSSNSLPVHLQRPMKPD